MGYLVNLMKEILLQYLLHILHLIHKQGFPFQWKTVLSELPVNKKDRLVSTKKHSEILFAKNKVKKDCIYIIKQL